MREASGLELRYPGTSYVFEISVITVVGSDKIASGEYSRLSIGATALTAPVRFVQKLVASVTGSATAFFRSVGDRWEPGQHAKIGYALPWADEPIGCQKLVLLQKWARGQVEARLANMQPCRIGMEACVGAHHLSRKLQRFACARLSQPCLDGSYRMSGSFTRA